MSILTADRLRQLIHYDPETGIFTWRKMWSGRGKGSPLTLPATAGTIHPEGYQRIQVDGFIYQGSHLAWLYMNGELPPFQIDHRNLNTSDDSWNNLRPATQTQNKANSRVYKNNKLGLKGVRRHRNGRYEARLRVGGSLQYLGCYKTAEEAKAVYDAAAIKHFGEFARSA